LYRIKNAEPELFLIHPGGPFWKNKDKGAWSIPKGEFPEDEEAIDAAKREFAEETGKNISGEMIGLEPVKQKGGKLVIAWAVEGDIDADQIKSNTFKMEWPLKSGIFREFPEVDKAAWFSISEAKAKINPAQAALIDDLLSRIK